MFCDYDIKKCLKTAIQTIIIIIIQFWHNSVSKEVV
jgi:hypothetical protein